MKASILVAGLILFATQVFADTYTYDITGPNATGYVTTSCDSCVLNASDVTAWNLAGFSSTVPGSTVVVTGNGFVATPTGIFFNFNPEAPLNDALFSELPNPTPIFGSPNSVEYANLTSALSFGPSGEATVCNTSLCYETLVSSNVDLGPLVRSVAAAPEIDPTTSGSALTLLLGTLAVLRGRRRATAI
jgi:hypothetical protein